MELTSRVYPSLTPTRCSSGLESAVNEMQTVNVKELAAQNRSLRHKRLETLRKSVESRTYRIEPVRIAGGIINEARMDARLRRHT